MVVPLLFTLEGTEVEPASVVLQFSAELAIRQYDGQRGRLGVRMSRNVRDGFLQEKEQVPPRLRIELDGLEIT